MLCYGVFIVVFEGGFMDLLRLVGGGVLSGGGDYIICRVTRKIRQV